MLSFLKIVWGGGGAVAGVGVGCGGTAAAAGLTAGQPRPLTPRGMSGGPYHVTTQFYFYPVKSKNAKCNQYLPVLLTSLSVSDSIFRKLVMLWMWRHHEMALCRQGGGAWHSALILTTASNANSWADVAYHLTRVWQAGYTENFDSVSRASFKRKPPCLGGMELVSLSCNRVFILAESVGRGWCKIAIATKWYPFHTTDKCCFLFMPWKTDQYTLRDTQN